MEIQSQSKNIMDRKRHPTNGSNSQHSSTSFRVLCSMIESSQNFENLKKKIKVKKINEAHTQSKIKSHEQLINKLKKAREEHEQFEKEKQLAKNQKFSYLHNLRLKNTAAKTQHQSRIQQLRRQISTSKYQEYRSICQQRKLIEKKIERNKQNTLFQKKHIRSKIILRESSGKKNLERFLHDRCESVHNKNIEDIARMTAQIQKQQKEAQQLQQDQVDLIVKHEETRMQFKQIKEEMASKITIKKLSRVGKKTSGKKEQQRASTRAINKKYQ